MAERANEQIVVPFLKWAGGKRWMTAGYQHLFPKEFDLYIEPFLGSGAVFFHLKPKTALLSDSNAALVNAYNQIRLNWGKVETSLSHHHSNHSKIYYYKERARKHRVDYERASQFIYLNRVCWNGLYRVNLRGEFNVPLGTKTSVILGSDDLGNVSKLLQPVAIIESDFEPVLAKAGARDFAFIDPPYVTRHNFNGFAKYNDRIFSWSDQERLAAAVAKAAKRGAKILVTNADHQSIRELYREHGELVTLTRNSVLAADSRNRGVTTEVAITINYRTGRAR